MTTALITGCSTGIGRATATELAGRGYDVVATARRPETLADLDVAARLTLDVDDDASVAAAVAAAGPVDVLVNNAGFEVAGPVEKVPLDAARRMFETNVFGALRMVQALVPGMRERGGGVVVNVTSLAGRVAPPLGGLYAATKHALEAVSEALHFEVSHFGIRVRVVEPGVIHTSFADNVRHLGYDGPPYDELGTQWDRAREVLDGGLEQGPELVATAIADAIESDAPRLRVPVGADAEMVVAAREAGSFEDFEASMRALLQLDW